MIKYLSAPKSLSWKRAGNPKEAQLRNPRAQGPAKLALAKLGETDQLQEFWCQAISEKPKDASATPLIFEQIGGWYSIQALQRFVTPAGQIHFAKAMAKQRAAHPEDRDLAVSASNMPFSYALQVLPRVVPNPPV